MESIAKLAVPTAERAHECAQEGPRIDTRLHCSGVPVRSLVSGVTNTFRRPPVTFRRDRFGECWHLIPVGDLGPRTRTLCGKPRQGTPLSETYADLRPDAPESICELCVSAYTTLAASV